MTCPWRSGFPGTDFKEKEKEKRKKKKK